MSSNIDNIGRHTIDFINNYSKKIMSCKDIQDYFNLISSVYIFQILVFKHIKYEFELDGTGKDADEFLSLLKKQAEELAEDFAKSFVNLENLDIKKTDIN